MTLTGKIILIDRSGSYNFLDWDDLALGSPEHDLVYFSNRKPERFEAFLRRYLLTNPAIHLHTELFAFYYYVDVMHQTAVYTGRILSHNVNRADAEQAWNELQPCMPANHEDIAAAIHQIATILRRLAH